MPSFVSVMLSLLLYLVCLQCSRAYVLDAFRVYGTMDVQNPFTLWIRDGSWPEGKFFTIKAKPLATNPHIQLIRPSGTIHKFYMDPADTNIPAWTTSGFQVDWKVQVYDWGYKMFINDLTVSQPVFHESCCVYPVQTEYSGWVAVNSPSGFSAERTTDVTGTIDPDTCTNPNLTPTQQEELGCVEPACETDCPPPAPPPNNTRRSVHQGLASSYYAPKDRRHSAHKGLASSYYAPKNRRHSGRGNSEHPMFQNNEKYQFCNLRSNRWYTPQWQKSGFFGAFFEWCFGQSAECLQWSNEVARTTESGDDSDFCVLWNTSRLDLHYVPNATMDEFFWVPKGYYDEVVASCEAHNGTIASIHSDEEHEKARKICHDIEDSNDKCYIGLEEDSSGNWHWHDGRPLDYTNWDTGQPEYWKDETKVAIWTSSSGKWHDSGNGLNRQYHGICRRYSFAVPKIINVTEGNSSTGNNSSAGNNSTGNNSTGTNSTGNNSSNVTAQIFLAPIPLKPPVDGGAIDQWDLYPDGLRDFDESRWKNYYAIEDAFTGTVNPCDEAPCHGDAICIPRGVWPGYSCRCQPGTWGDGYSCNRTSWALKVSLNYTSPPDLDAVRAEIADMLATEENPAVALDVTADLNLAILEDGTIVVEFIFLYPTFEVGQESVTQLQNLANTTQSNLSDGSVVTPPEDPDPFIYVFDQPEIPVYPNVTCIQDEWSTICSCAAGFVNVNPGSPTLECANIDECSADPFPCVQNAFCDDVEGSFTCLCQPGFVGDGVTECEMAGYTVRVTIQYGSRRSGRRELPGFDWDTVSRQFALLLDPDNVDAVQGSMSYVEEGNLVTVYALFSTRGDAMDARGRLPSGLLAAGSSFFGGTVLDPPQIYFYITETSSGPYLIESSGLTVDTVSFDIDCEPSTAGCWVVDIVYTSGPSKFNVLYIPDAVGQGSPSSYTYTEDAVETFYPVNFPCTSKGLGTNGNGPMDDGITACCIPEFIERYRTVTTFMDDPLITPIDASGCDARNHVFTQDSPPSNAVDGPFRGLNYSHAQYMGVYDHMGRTKKAQLTLDEVELRSLAGQTTGTPGVEHSIETFIGLAEFSPTDTYVLDSFAKQVILHLERNDFFVVAVHGTDQQTFLESINVRLIEVVDQLGDGPPIHWVQVTFSFADRYVPNSNDQLVPPTSVLIGTGVKRSRTALDHICTDDGPYFGPGGVEATFDQILSQPCAPDAQMCSSPSTVPDSFVSYNVPIHFDVEVGKNIFVEFVVSIVGADGELQWTTKLNAAIPVTQAGIQRSCDSTQAATDLKQVADADLIIGSASSIVELERLRIFSGIGSTNQSLVESTRIDTDSIESGLMTLVVKGDKTFFNRSGTTGFSLEVEDIVTIHIMESNAENDPLSVFYQLVELANNGDLFEVDINVAEKRAFLLPSDTLQQNCRATAQPSSNPNSNMMPTTCVLRRDMKERDFPQQQGATLATAMELFPYNLQDTEAEGAAADFMQSILGSSDYAEALGRNYSRAIQQRFALNQRYTRAFWVNPGYEWVPSQTNGASLFQLSQRILFFALINLNEAGLGSRRMLLQATNTGTGLQSANLVFNSGPSTLLAKMFNVDEESVASWLVEIQLTETEACMPAADLREHMRETCAKYLAETASEIETVQVGSVSVDAAGVTCDRRAGRKLKASSYFSQATAVVEMMVVFHRGQQASFDMAHFSKMPGVNSIKAQQVPRNVAIVEDEDRMSPDDDTEDAKDSSEVALALIVGIAAGGVLVLALVAFIIYRYRTSSAEPEVYSVRVGSFVGDEFVDVKAPSKASLDDLMSSCSETMSSDDKYRNVIEF
eukprot:CAMPEP_0181331448 /NCGR_PEP_ID=MMETSP1101-20121128/24503_1 /TAXON_ID=46948 /ORGANISM="Rhodomonas abbreviata, Strain Caron Lab Isolate" /LENGTH=1819 /DNA_ID=CAMNT_0023440901 /DNA_START=147 /DNA_END=5606 /DNA_ORIENTATION=+